MQAGGKMTGLMAEDQGSVKSEDSLTGRAKFLCSYGGRIMPRPHDSQLRYVGGETRILSVHRGISYLELMAKLKRLCNNDNVSLKYQLPNEDLDALVSVLSDEDLENMMEEYDRIESKDSSSRLRLFLFPSSSKQAAAKVEQHPQDHPVDAEHKFVEAVNGILRKPDIPGVDKLAAANFPAVLHQHGPICTSVPQTIPPVPVAHVCGGLGAPSTVTPQIVGSLVPPPVAAPASSLLHGTSPQVLATPAANVQTPQVLTNPAANVQTPQVLANPAANVQTPQVLANPAANVQTPQVLTNPAGATPQVLTSPQVFPNVVAAVPKLLAPTNPLVRVPTTPIAVLPSPVVQVLQRPAASMAASRPGYVPLVDVSRGMLPKGMVLRQYSLDEDHADSASSQSSGQVTVHGNSELVYLDRRDSDELQAGMVQVQEDRGYFGGGQSKPDSHLERYLKEQTMGETQHQQTQAPHQHLQYLISDPVQRVASAPQLQTVDVIHGKHLHRQFSDHPQESPRPAGICAAHMHSPLQPAASIATAVVAEASSILPMDTKPVLHQMNAVHRPPHHPVAHPEHKVVPQFVHPFQN